jgi:glucokinase
MAEPLCVGLDVGGTTMKAGVVDDAGQLLSHVNVPTEAAKGQAHGLATMAETIRQAVAAANLPLDRIAAIGVATPGSMDLATGVILDPPNLKPWRNVPVRQYIADTFQLPTAFQNDANAAAFGESWVGVGKDHRSLVLFTLGTGIGGGIVLDGRILEGAHSHGGELGHMKVDITGGRQCRCGQRGCVEAYASATAVVARTYEALQQDGGQSQLHSAGELTAQTVFAAADAGDALAKSIVDRTAFYLAVGVANVIHTIDPELICFGGGMIAAGEPFLNLVRRYVRDVAFAWPAERVIIRYAALGNDAGMIGAAGCAKLLLNTGK